MEPTQDGTGRTLGETEVEVRELAAEMTSAVDADSGMSRRDLGHLLRHRWWSGTMKALRDRVLVEHPDTEEVFASALREVLAREGSVVSELEPKQRRIYQLLSAGRADLAALLPDVPGGTRLVGRELGAEDLRAGYDLAEQIVRSSAPEQFVVTIYEVHLLRQLVAVVDTADDETFSELAEIAGRFAQRFKPYVLHAPFWPWTGSLTAATAHSPAAARDLVRVGTQGRLALVRGGRSRWSLRPEAPIRVSTPLTTVFRDDSTLSEEVTPVPPFGADGVLVPRAVLSRNGSWSVWARFDLDDVADVPLLRGAAGDGAPARLTLAGGTDRVVLHSSKNRHRERTLRGVTRPASD